MANSAFNSDLLEMARRSVKRAFVDAAAAGGGGGDPMASAMAGPMPPLPPMGADPAAGGGAPPADPAAAGAAPAAGGGVTADEVKAIVEQALLAQGGAGGAGGAGGQKMKVDVNQEIYQIKKLMVMMMENMGMEVPASMLLGDPAMDPAIPQSQAAQDPASAAATQAGAGIGSAINPINPMQGASPALAAGGGGGSGGGAEKAGAAASSMQQGTAVDMTRAQQLISVSGGDSAERLTEKSSALLTRLRALHSAG